MTSRFYTPAEAAEQLGVDAATVRRAIRAGELHALATPGGHHRIPEAELATYLQRTQGVGGPAIIACVNQKGGVGKTTTTAALGAAAADAGVRVLLVDWDPQASLTTALAVKPIPVLYDAIRAYIDGEDRPPLPITELPGGEHLIPGHLDLASAEIDLVHAEDREHVLGALLNQVVNRYDLVLIDCPPTLGLLTVNVLVYVTGVLIPVTPEYLAAQGLVRLGQTIARIRRRQNKNLQILGVLPTMFRARTLHHQEILDQVAAWALAEGVPLLPAVPNTIKASEAAGAGIPLTRYPGGNGAAQVYRDLLVRLVPQEVLTHAR